MTGPLMENPILELMSGKKNKYKIVNRFIILLGLVLMIQARPGSPSASGKNRTCRIMFYNTENFFDTKDDPLTNDQEFLPTSKKHWTPERYNEKLHHVFQVIAAIGETDPPAIAGFAEIENRGVLNDLIHKTLLEKYPYKIIHKDSPDLRGIDVGLIYRTDKIKCLNYKFFRINFPGNPVKKTRDILYFEGLLGKDTLHVFVNHWPSRYGGKKRSEPSRIFVASVLKNKTDSILKRDPCARIVVMGDFNDDPTNESINKIFGARISADNASCKSMVDLSGILKKSCHCGSLKYGAAWNMFDQFIVSGSMLSDIGAHTSVNDVHVAHFPFLLVTDRKYGGYKPFRTYYGPVYKGGYSDHLPVYLDIFY